MIITGLRLAAVAREIAISTQSRLDLNHRSRLDLKYRSRLDLKYRTRPQVNLDSARSRLDLDSASTRSLDLDSISARSRLLHPRAARPIRRPPLHHRRKSEPTAPNLIPCQQSGRRPIHRPTDRAAPRRDSAYRKEEPGAGQRRPDGDVASAPAKRAAGEAAAGEAAGASPNRSSASAFNAACLRRPPPPPRERRRRRRESGGCCLGA